MSGLAYRVAEKKLGDWAVPKMLGYRARPLPVAVWVFIRSAEGKLSVTGGQEAEGGLERGWKRTADSECYKKD